VPLRRVDDDVLNEDWIKNRMVRSHRLLKSCKIDTRKKAIERRKRIRRFLFLFFCFANSSAAEVMLTFSRTAVCLGVCQLFAVTLSLVPEPITFWTFQEPPGAPKVSKGKHNYSLHDADVTAPVVRCSSL
jgi:hypothetical protein